MAPQFFCEMAKPQHVVVSTEALDFRLTEEAWECPKFSKSTGPPYPHVHQIRARPCLRKVSYVQSDAGLLRHSRGVMVALKVLGYVESVGYSFAITASILYSPWAVIPGDPNTQQCRCMIEITLRLTGSGTRNMKHWVSGSFGIASEDQGTPSHICEAWPWKIIR